MIYKRDVYDTASVSFRSEKKGRTEVDENRVKRGCPEENRAKRAVTVWRE